MQRDQSLRILVNIRKIRKRTLACGQKSRRDDAQTAISRSIAALFLEHSQNHSILTVHYVIFLGPIGPLELGLSVGRLVGWSEVLVENVQWEP